MARGFESKAVADQQEAAQDAPSPRATSLSRTPPCSRRSGASSCPGPTCSGGSSPPRPRGTARCSRGRCAPSTTRSRPSAERSPMPRLPGRLGPALAVVRARRPGAPRPVSRADVLPARAEHLVGLRHPRAPRPRGEDARRPGARRLAQPVAGARRRAVVPPLPERLQELEEHVLPSSPGGQLRGDRMPEDGWGWTDVVSIRRPDGVDLLRRRHVRAPRRRQRRRPHGVAGAAARSRCRPAARSPLDVAFKAKLPRVFARTGFFRDYFLVGQWFPKLGVYEPAGTRGRASGGWNCHQFHANSEFYADFGRYRVEITLPKRFVVGATGRRTGAAGEPGRHLHPRVRAGGRASTSPGPPSPRFLEVKSTFSAEKDVTAAGVRGDGEARSVAALDEVRLSDVDVTILLQPGARGRRPSGTSKAAKAAIQWFGLWYGRYPYPTLTVVDPAFGAGGSGGMEYPTFITAGTSRALQPLAARPGPRPGGRHRPRVRPPVLAEHGRRATSSRSRGSTRASTRYSTGKVMERGLRAVDGRGSRPAAGRARVLAGPELASTACSTASAAPRGASPRRATTASTRTRARS